MEQKRPNEQRVFNQWTNLILPRNGAFGQAAITLGFC
jgi:hypothetical protein